MQQTVSMMVHIGEVISALGGTSEARTVARWMAASEVIPKSTPGYGGAGRADLSRRDVAMIVLGMAAPVAKRAPDYANELAQTVSDGQTLVDILTDALSDHERLRVAEVWLPAFEGGFRPNVKLTEYVEGEGFKERVFLDTRGDKGDGVPMGKTDDFDVYRPADPAPAIERWVKVDGERLIALAKLFVEREGATTPVAVVEDTAA